MRVGVGVGSSEDLAIAVQQGLARDVEAAGFASLWTNEANGRDALLVCQAWALATERLEVGVGVAPIWTRTPAQLAMASATLQDASGGRFILGLGVGHPATMGPWHGVEFRKPRAAAEELLRTLDDVFEGDSAGAWEMLSAGFRLDIDPLPQRPTIHLAAMGPRMLETAGGHADGTLLNWSTPGTVEQAGSAVRTAAEQAGRETPEVVAYVRVVVDPDRDAARAALARQVGQYVALPAYAAHFERQGLGDTVAAVKAAFQRGGPDAVPGAIDDDVLARLGWWGTPEDDPANALAVYEDAGLDHLVARVVPVGDDPVASIQHVLTALRSRGPADDRPRHF